MCTTIHYKIGEIIISKELCEENFTNNQRNRLPYEIPGIHLTVNHYIRGVYSNKLLVQKYVEKHKKVPRGLHFFSCMPYKMGNRKLFQRVSLITWRFLEVTELVHPCELQHLIFNNVHHPHQFS